MSNSIIDTIDHPPARVDSPLPKTFTAHSPEAFGVLIKKLVTEPSSFTLQDTHDAFNHLAVEGCSTPPQIAAFLTALHMSGLDKQPSTVAACADVMQHHATPVDVGNFGEGPICDIVGSGGDGHNTFNVSTASGIVAAGAGCRVYKHGNRSATSSSGSADILASLGCPVTQLKPETISTIAKHSPFLFLFAPNYHPAMVKVAPIRKTIGFPTVFNALGPLINPARPTAMIVGVHSPFLGPVFIEALRVTGVERAWVVCGYEFLDEISPEGATHVWELVDGEVTKKDVHPSDFGLPSNAIATVKGGLPEENAEKLLALLNGKLGQEDPVENYVMLNTAALLYVAGKVTDLKEGVRLARESVASGKALNALDAFRTISQKVVSSIANGH